MMNEEELDQWERDANRLHSAGGWTDILATRVGVLIAEIRELKKSSGYAPKPHYEEHWDRGSMEEV